MIIPGIQVGKKYDRIVTKSFTNAELVAFKLTVTHNLKTLEPSVSIYNNYDVIDKGVTEKVIDLNTVELNFYAAIPGTWKYKITKV